MGKIPEDVLKRLDTIAVMPHVAQKVLSVLNNDDVTAQDIHDIVLKDEGLTSAILKVVNSAYYSGNRKISTIKDAVVRLGFMAVKNLVIAYASKKFYEDAKSLMANKLWQHSQAVAFLTAEIAKMKGYKNIELAFISGLLHDIGKTFMLQFYSDAYDLILSEVYTDRESFLLVEEEKLDFTHVDLANTVLKSWNFDDLLIDAIGKHHMPEEVSDDEPLALYINLADYISYNLGYAVYQKESELFSLQSAQRIGFSAEDYEKVKEKVKDAEEKGELFI